MGTRIGGSRISLANGGTQFGQHTRARRSRARAGEIDGANEPGLILTPPRERQSKLAVLGSIRPLEHGDGLLEEGLGLAIVTTIAIELTEIVYHRGGKRGLAAGRLLQYRERTVEERLRLPALRLCVGAQPRCGVTGQRHCMPSVFIFHVSDDKDRLAPFIQHLLDKLDPDVGVWIDAANKVEGLVPHPRLSSIEPGEDWLQRIHTELAEEGCIVLGFWSARATARPREVFLREVDIARKFGRFVPVSLDPMDVARIPAPFSGDHIHDVSKFGSPSDQGEFDLVVGKLQHLLRKRSVQVAIDEDRLPYLADRQPQIARICNAVEASLLDGRTHAAGPLCFIVPCHADDVADMFLWRLTQKDGPEHCGLAQSHDQAGWVDLLLKWPRTTKPEQFLKEFGE